MSEIPMDPVEVENLPPADLNACARCNGTGGVHLEWNAWVGDIYDVCPDCHGTGEVTPLGGAA